MLSREREGGRVGEGKGGEGLMSVAWPEQKHEEGESLV